MAENKTVATSTTQVNKEQSIFLSINEETQKLADSLFEAQDDITNRTRWERKIAFDALKMYGKSICTQAVNKFEREVHKLLDLHPTWNKEQAVTEILVSKKGRELKELADKAAVLLESLK